MELNMDMENIENNWNTYKTILNRLSDENIDEMLDSIGERLCLAPANNNNKQYGCYAGGIVVTSTKLAKAMQALNEFHGNPANIKSVYKVGLLIRATVRDRIIMGGTGLIQGE